jgi:hypothetical protein
MEAELLFHESSAAAQSMKNFWTRMASTYKCIEIRLTQTQLSIKPHRFIGGLIKLLALDLHHSIPTNRIRAVENQGKWLNYDKIQVRFERQDAAHEILLYLKNGKAFCDRLETVSKL